MNEEQAKVKSIRKDSLETRRRLVDAAEQLFAGQSIESVTLVDVSRAAGQKNRNAAQYHYGDRLGLINAVLNKHSEMITVQRCEMLDHLEQGGPQSMYDLVAALVFPVVNHVQSDPNGLTYLMLNRQIISSAEYKILFRRVNDLPEVLRLQRLMRGLMAAHSKGAMQAKMILIHCMLFNGLASFYDLHPEGVGKVLIDTLCASIAAVLLEGLKPPSNLCR